MLIIYTDKFQDFYFLFFDEKLIRKKLTRHLLLLIYLVFSSFSVGCFVTLSSPSSLSFICIFTTQYHCCFSLQISLSLKKILEIGDQLVGFFFFFGFVCSIQLLSQKGFCFLGFALSTKSLLILREREKR